MSHSHILSWLVVLVLTFQSTHIHAITSAEYDSLISLYNSTSGASWNTPWNLSTDPCTWFGIKCGTLTNIDVSITTIANNEQFCIWNGINGNCTHTNYHITSIALIDQKLNGTLPLSAISGFSWLFGFFISDAPSLTGTLPPFLSHPYLTNLKIMDTGLSGEFPPINARNNDNDIVQNVFPLEIAVERSQFTGISDAATQPGNAWGFQRFYFVQVPIQNISRFFAMLPNTTVEIHCYWCDFKGSIPSLSSEILSNLKSLSLFGGELTGSFLHLIPNNTVLTRIVLDRNHLSGELGIIPGTTLEIFSITGNEFTGSHPILDAHTQLFQLDLAENQFTTFAPSLPFPKLKEYIISTNLISGPLPDYFSQPGYLSNMATLDVSRNLINGTTPTFAGLGNAMTSLNFADNDLTGLLPIDNLCTRFPALSVIKAGGNGYKGSFPDLTNCTSLTELEIPRTLLNGTLPPTLPSKLFSLDVSNNFFTGSVYNYTNIFSLRISCNDFSPPLPSSSLFTFFDAFCYDGMYNPSTCPSCTRPAGFIPRPTPTPTPTTTTPTDNSTTGTGSSSSSSGAAGGKNPNIATRETTPFIILITFTFIMATIAMIA